MKTLIVFAFVGFVAQLIDGSLGMSYGLVSTSFLLSFGFAPAVVSASIHMAEIATTAVSGFSHIRFNNVDKQVTKTLIIPGCIGAFLGAFLLSYLPGHLIKPYIAGLLFMLGCYVLFRFLFDKGKIDFIHKKNAHSKTAPKSRLLYPLALSAGFLDTFGGGGWGELNTSVLMTQTRMKPRMVVGSVDASEFFISISATIGFLLFLGVDQINWTWAAVFAIAGFIAAPIAAWLAKILPSFILGTLVGGLIMITSTKTLLMSLNNVIPSSIHDAVYTSIITIWILSVVFGIWNHKLKNIKKKGDQTGG